MSRSTWGERRGERYLILPKMTVSRRRTRWPNRDWSGPNAKLNKLGIMTPEHREEGFQLQT